MRHRTASMRLKLSLAAIAILLLLVPVLLSRRGPIELLVLGPPDTFEDMWQSVERLPVPAGSRLIGKDWGGLRSHFAGASRPRVSLAYSTDWADGKLCSQLKELAVGLVPAEPVRSQSCSWKTTVRSGWSARLVNVWTYEVSYSATSPEKIQETAAAVNCERARADIRPENRDDLFIRFEPCWVNAGEALVLISLQGKYGW